MHDVALNNLNTSELALGMGFYVSSPCGRVWLVPLDRVKNDFRAYLESSEGLTNSEADEQLQRNSYVLKSWFHANYDWGDIARSATLITPAIESEVERARLDRIQELSELDPGDCAVAVLA